MRMTHALRDRLLASARRTGAAGDAAGAAIFEDAYRRVSGCESRKQWCGYAACPRCSAHRSHRVIGPIDAAIRARGVSPADLEWTTFSVPSRVLNEGVATLKDALRELRGTASFAGVVGGAIGIHPLPDEGDNCWHVHAHVLLEKADGAAFNSTTIEREWGRLLRARGKSGRFWRERKALHLSKGARFRALAEYVGGKTRKYLLALDDRRLAEWLWFIGGQRLVSRVGSWRGQVVARPGAREK